MTPQVKNRVFIALVVVSNTVGTLFLSMGMAQMPPFSMGSLAGYTLAFLTNGWVLGGVALMALWMFAQLSMYTWADLTYVLPVTASAYLLTALLGRFVLDERISMVRWAGIALISFGVIFVSETPPRMPESSNEAGR